MNNEQALKIVNEIFQSVFRKENFSTLDEIKRKYAYDINLPIEVQDSTTGETTWTDTVDDVRTILNEYPYVGENTTQEVTEIFYFSSFELPYLNLEEFDPFYTPTVEDNPLENNTEDKNVKMMEKTYR